MASYRLRRFRTRRPRLKKLDSNGDGKLSREEWLPRLPVELPGGRLGDAAPARLGAAFIERLLQSTDRNGDGKLSRDELPERLQGLLQGRGGELFERADANKDGALDRQELENLLERLPRPGARGGERPEGDRPAGERPRPDRPGDRPAGERPRTDQPSDRLR
ncbi:MAG: hypothetical protein KatS3mg109_0800 [Pirellulaceae bacterium]|nr:MAG: hypothetical protein KatS3mg109_0800 [Pirellulaceae bacterium]